MSEADFQDIIPALEKGGKIAIDRYGALGDLIQLLPVARYLKRKYPIHLTLVCQLSFGHILEREKDAFDSIISKSKFCKFDYKRSFYLDGVLECDHSTTNEDNNYHRTKLYERFFGIEVDRYDWHLTLTHEELKKAEGLLNVT
jgi:hypothetical protein